MSRIRTVKPEFSTSESLGRVSRDARLMFVLIWPQCDDHGRFRASPRMLAATLFPYDDDAPARAAEWLGELAHQDCVRLYEVEGSAYGYVPKWTEHQKIERPSKPKYPDPPAAPSKRRGKQSVSPRPSAPAPSPMGRVPVGESSPNPHRILTEPSMSPPLALNEPSPLEGKGREGKGPKLLSGAVEFSDPPSLPAVPGAREEGREVGKAFSLWANGRRVDEGLTFAIDPSPAAYEAALAEATDAELREAFEDFLGTADAPGWGAQRDPETKRYRNASLSLFFSGEGGVWRDRVKAQRARPAAEPEPPEVCAGCGEAGELKRSASEELTCYPCLRRCHGEVGSIPNGAGLAGISGYRDAVAAWFVAQRRARGVAEGVERKGPVAAREATKTAVVAFPKKARTR